MERCNQLKEYAQFIACIRQMQQRCGRIEDAVDLAIQACISQGILKDILSVHRKEVVSLFLTEYNEQAHMKMERDEWIAVGEERGLQRGIQQGVQQGIQQARQIFDLHINQHLSVPEIARKLSIPEDSVREFLP